MCESCTVNLKSEDLCVESTMYLDCAQSIGILSVYLKI